MAKHRGRGFATIEYPTGMNQNGDPSQAWIKLKPDGRVDVFAGTVDIGQGSKTVHTQIVADALGVPYDWVTMDNSNTDSSAVCTGHVRLARHVHRRQRGALAAERVRERILDIASKELEIDAGRPRDRRRRGVGEGRAADSKISVADVAGAATYNYGELISGSSTALKPFAEVDDDERAGRDRAALGDLLRRVRRRRRGRRRDRRGRRARRWCRSTTSAARSTRRSSRARSRAARSWASGSGCSRTRIPYYPSVEHRGGQFGAYLGPALRGPAGARQRDPREPVGRRPVRREGDRRDGEQRAAAGDRERDLRRRRRVGDRDAGDARARARGARGEARAAPRRQARDLRRGPVGEDGVVERRARGTSVSMPEPPVAAVPHLERRATRGSSSTACACTRSAASRCCSAACSTSRGSRCPWHKHEDTEQVMFILDGEVEMTIEDETRDAARGRRRRRQPRPAPRAALRARRDVHGGAVAGAARPRARPEPRSRARPRRRRRSTWSS